MSADPTRNTRLSENRYISARISTTSSPGVSLKNSTTPRSKAVMWTISAR